MNVISVFKLGLVLSVLTAVLAQATKTCTRQGFVCVFPFTYRGTIYNNCTDYRSVDLWCGLHSDLKGTSNKLGVDYDFCHDRCPPANAERCTTEGYQCVFPFESEGVEYSQCTTGGGWWNRYTWCAITPDFNDKDEAENVNWGKCVDECPADGPKTLPSLVTAATTMVSSTTPTPKASTTTTTTTLKPTTTTTSTTPVTTTTPVSSTTTATTTPPTTTTTSTTTTPTTTTTSTTTTPTTTTTSTTTTPPTTTTQPTTTTTSTTTTQPTTTTTSTTTTPPTTKTTTTTAPITTSTRKVPETDKPEVEFPTTTTKAIMIAVMPTKQQGRTEGVANSATPKETKKTPPTDPINGDEDQQEMYSKPTDSEQSVYADDETLTEKPKSNRSLMIITFVAAIVLLLVGVLFTVCIVRARRRRARRDRGDGKESQLPMTEWKKEDETDDKKLDDVRTAMLKKDTEKKDESDTTPVVKCVVTTGASDSGLGSSFASVLRPSK